MSVPLPYSTGFLDLQNWLAVNGEWGYPVVNLLPNGDFESGIAGWDTYIVGAGNIATLTSIADAYGGLNAGLFDCTSLQTPEPDGFVSLQHSFNPAGLVGKSLRATFAYKSNVPFNFFVISIDDLDVEHWDMLNCPASVDWMLMSIDSTPASSYSASQLPWVDFRLYDVGYIAVDDAVLQVL